MTYITEKRPLRAFSLGYDKRTYRDLELAIEEDGSFSIRQDAEMRTSLTHEKVTPISKERGLALLEKIQKQAQARAQDAQAYLRQVEEALAYCKAQ